MDTPNNGLAVARHARRYAAVVLVLLGALVTVAIVAVTTRERIDRNQRAWFLARLDALVPATLHDNDLYADRIVVIAPESFGTATPIAVFRARLRSEPTAALFVTTATDGYGGNIELLVAVDLTGTLLGVDVLRHHETQGIGDEFEPRRSDWLTKLTGRSLTDPAAPRWTIRNDGGEFDQFTGASITPRAILKAVRRTLEYYAAHRERLFDAPSVR